MASRAHSSHSLLSMEEAARRVGLTAPTLRQAARRSEIPVVAIGSRMYVSEETVRALMTPRLLPPTNTNGPRSE